jgi:hypothetical protein
VSAVVSDGNRPLIGGRSGLVLIAALLVLSTLAGVGYSRAPPPPTVVPAASVATVSHPSVALPPRSTATQFLNATFFGTNTTFANTPSASWPCSAAAWRNYSFLPFEIENQSYENCYGGAQSPSVLPLANGHLGVAYSLLTTNHTACSAYGSLVVSRIGFQVSTDGGKTYGAAKYLGNQSCSELQAIEPSFAVSSDGDVDGVFVQDNFTSRNTTYYGGLALPAEYGNRTNDSLGFLRSTDNGTGFSPVTTIAPAGGADIARPQLATFGRSIYVVYDRMNNWTNLSLPVNYPYPPAEPLSVELVYSGDNGAIWNGPYTLPGLNGSSGYSAESPSISVSTSGELAVAYTTDRGCFAGAGPFCNSFGDSVVVSTSTTNGSTWSAPSVVAPSVGETQCQGYDNDSGPGYWYGCFAYQFQDAPETTVAWSDTNATGLYVAWSGMYNWTDSTFGVPINEIGEGGIWSAASQTAGVSWANATVIAPQTPGTYDEDYHYEPVLAVHGGVVSLAYTYENVTYCNGACPFSQTFSYWLTNSTDGLAWLPPSLLAIDPVPDYEIFDYWGGYTDALAFDGGSPVIAFSQPVLPVEGFQQTMTYVNSTPDYFSWNNDTGQSDLTVAYVWTGATTAVMIDQNGLPSGAGWSFSLGPATVTTTSASVRIGNVPRNQTLLLDPGPATGAGGFWTEYGPTTQAGFVQYHAPSTAWINYTIEYGLQVSFQPLSVQNFYFNLNVNNSFYDYNVFGGVGHPFPAFPWYLPAGTVVPFDGSTMNSVLPVSYFNGTGNGSSTVVSNTTSITMDGPINETLWGGAIGAYTLTFVPTGLTPSLSYQFTFDGTVYQGGGTTNVTIPQVLTGAYALSGIEANSSTAGWEYFGAASSGSPVIVPEQTEIVLNFSAAYVDLGASPGTVSFHAAGLSTGDVWRMSFNGTTFASATPWINVTTRPGTFGVSALPVAASANDTTSYAPAGFGPTLSVVTGGVYPVSYAPAFRVQVLSGQGGTITGGGTRWLAPGTVANFTATPRANYQFLSWAGSGPGSYTGPLANASLTVGGPITEAATFEAQPLARFNLTFLSLGLPSETWWTVDVNGTGFATNQTDLVVSDLDPCSAGAAGRYPVSVPYTYRNGSEGTRFVPTPPTSPVCTTGTTNVSVAFAAEYLVTPVATPGGQATVGLGGLPSSAPTWVPAEGPVELDATPNSDNLSFTGWVGSGPGNYTGPLASEQIEPAGPITETAFFRPVVVPPPPTYNVSFHTPTSFVAGTAWSVTVDRTNYTSTGDWINVTNLSSGTHAVSVRTVLSPDGQTRYTPTVASTKFAEPGSSSLTVAFAVAFWVSVSSTAGGTLVGATDDFIASGDPVTLNASPLPGETFAGWSGTGSGSYTGPQALQTIVIDGPVSEFATFSPVPATSTATSAIDSPAVLAGLAAAGLVVGVAAGLLAFRRRARPPEGAGPEGTSP